MSDNYRYVEHGYFDNNGNSVPALEVGTGRNMEVIRGQSAIDEYLGRQNGAEQGQQPEITVEKYDPKAGRVDKYGNIGGVRIVNGKEIIGDQEWEEYQRENGQKSKGQTDKGVPEVKSDVEHGMFGGFKKATITLPDGTQRTYNNEEEYERELSRYKALAEGNKLFGSIAPHVPVEIISGAKVEFAPQYVVGVKCYKSKEEAEKASMELKTALKKGVQEVNDPVWGKSYKIEGNPHHFSNREEANEAFNELKEQNPSIQKIDASKFEPKYYVINGQTYLDKNSARVAAAQAEKEVTRFKDRLSDANVGGKIISDGKGWGGKFKAQIGDIQYFDQETYKRDLEAAKIKEASKFMSFNQPKAQPVITEAIKQELIRSGFSSKSIEMANQELEEEKKQLTTKADIERMKKTAAVERTHIAAQDGIATSFLEKYHAAQRQGDEAVQNFLRESVEEERLPENPLISRKDMQELEKIKEEYNKSIKKLHASDDARMNTYKNIEQQHKQEKKGRWF